MCSISSHFKLDLGSTIKGMERSPWNAKRNKDINSLLLWFHKPAILFRVVALLESNHCYLKGHFDYKLFLTFFSFFGKGHSPVSINTVYWNTVAPICLYIVYDCFHDTIELNSWDRYHMAHKVKNIYYLACYQKSYPTPALEHHPPQAWPHSSG